MKDEYNKDKEFRPKDQLTGQIKEAYQNANRAIKDFETQREQWLNQAHQAEKEGNNAIKEELLKKATHCDIAINAIGYSMQENFGLLNMEEKGQDKQDKK